MTEQKIAEVVFECGDKKLERKLESPTRGLLERVLEGAGLEGVWTLRDSRRIRRKGRGRFSAIRMESRCGAKSIRIWCKPQGNDTSFEYSLYPPKDEDIDLAYRLLSRVHPVTMQISESDLLPKVFLDRVAKVDPIGRNLRPVKCVEVGRDEECGREMKGSDEEEIQIAEEGDEPCVGIPSLALDPSWELWQDEAVDRALMALSFVAEEGYAKKSEASASIIEHLNIKGFCGGASDSYTSVEGSMRSLTMALWKRKRYIERVKGNPRNGRGASESVRGYMITNKGQKRLELIKDGFGQATVDLMNPRWRRREDGASRAQISDAVAPSMWRVSEIKELVASHDLAESQIKEMEELIAVVDSDLEALDIEIASLDEEIRAINEKRRALEEKIADKGLERQGFREAQISHEQERDRIERIMGAKR